MNHRAGICFNRATIVWLYSYIIRWKMGKEEFVEIDVIVTHGYCWIKEKAVPLHFENRKPPF